MYLIKRFTIKSSNQWPNVWTFHKCLNESKDNPNHRLIANEPIGRQKSPQSPQQFCMDFVKKYDFESYLSALVLSERSVRRHLFAVKAFNAQLSQTRDMTSSELMAQMRLQYWSDLIDHIFVDTPVPIDINEPIAYELKHSGTNSKTSKYWLKKLIETRMDSRNLSDFPFQTIEELDKYSESSVTPIYHLIVECMTGLRDVSVSQRIDLDHISSHLGRAQGLCNVLRGVTHNAKHNRCYIPNDLLLKHKTSHEDLMRGKVNDNVIELSYDLAVTANTHIETILKLIKKIDGQNRAVFLPVFSIQNYLKRLEKCHFNPFDPKLYQRNGLLPFILWYKSKVL